MTNAVLRVRDLGKRFGAETALDGISFDIRGGQVNGLIGPDGAGKTTLMRLACGLLQADSGSVEVLGLDADTEALNVQQVVGYMPQRFGLYEDLSVAENLDLYADLQGVEPELRPERYAELMDMTGLGKFTGRLAGRLSGGMKQKLGLACTLVRPPQLLLLDEPTVGVDPVSRRELWDIVYRLVRESGMGVLLSTAYLDEAERCADVVLLHHGRVVGQGAPRSFSEPLTGRCFEVTSPSGDRRRLQTELAARPGIMDATLQGEAVRIVMAEAGQQPELADEQHYRAVAPRFEDAFVDRLQTTPRRLPAELSTHTRAAGTVITVEQLERRFGDFYAVRDLNFTIRAGEVFGLLGANGAGKTTTFRMLCGLLPPTGGNLQVAGEDLRHAPGRARARIGYMSQKFSLYSHLTVRQNLRFFSSAYNLRGSRRHERIAWALQAFELEHHAEAESGTLPLGYKQRLALAAALMHEPDILFLDEPTSGVDPLARRDFWSRINTLAEAGVTVLVTTHFMEEAEYCDRLAIMADGEILALGTPADIKRHNLRPGDPVPNMEEAFIRLIQRREAA
jgi:ABC-2 type transport system ATP-binding protein